ncbi:MAG: PAS domain-containing protein [Bacteroidetes bacterium]|jgi:PAS domain S-box-containing protein|nr:PAS domain-containing protein [Bacteroidota bacterium]MBT6687971.1 PAS domain-containing protein [Bacteroidota bacterium]MBT7144964.1 PAS domain-containing protein [Bacteroidota bacterium]MBT7492134.1 PAS domain-containing protein [Bacteroidota bacterium]
MNYKFDEIFDIEELRNICESFTELTGTTTSILDLDNNVLIATGWQPICTQFHRINNHSSKRCTESNAELTKQLKEGKKYSLYKCKNGLMDVAMTIMVRNTHVGNFLTGQFLTEKPDVDFFRKQAENFGFNEHKYLAALENVPVYNEEKIKKTIQFLVALTETIGNIGARNLENIEINKQLETDKKNISEANKELQIAQKTLKENEEKFRNITEQVTEMIFLTDDKSTIKYISPSSNSIFGYTPQEMEGKLFMKFLKKTEIPKAMKEFIKTFMKGTPTINLELLMKHKNGNYFVGELTVRKYNSDKLKGTIGLIRNISEKKKTEEELLFKEREFRTLTENMPGIIFRVFCKEDNKMVFYNDMLLEFTGYKSEELMRGNVCSLFPRIHPEDQAYIEKDVAKAISKKASFNLEYRFKHKNGEIRHFSEIGNPIFDTDDTLLYLEGMIFDITERKKAEEAHRNEKRFIEKAIDSLPGIFYLFNSKGKFLRWNQNFEIISEYSAEEIVKMHPLDFFSTEDKELVSERIKETFEKGESSVEAHWLSKNGNKILYYLTGTLIEFDGMYCLVGMGIDISERNQAEEKIKDKNEQFETIIKGANLGWWDWNIPSGDKIYNDILVENLGYKLSEIKPHIKWWEDKIHPDDAEQVSIDLQEHFKGKTEFYENKHRLRTKTGQWKWFLDYGKVVERDSKGNSIRMIGTLRDIDFEERAKEKINTSLQQIKVINANTPNIIWKSDIDKDGNFKDTYISEAVDQFLALPKGSVGNSWGKYYSYILPKYLPLINDIFKYGIENPNKSISFDYEVKKADGKLAFFSSTGRAVFENKKLTVYGSTIDITEKKQNELELLKAKEKAEESEEQLKRIANNFVDGMIYQVAMLDENKRKFNYVSDAVSKLYGCTAEQAQENPDLIYGKLHPEDVADLIKAEKDALKNMSIFKTTCRIINPDGSIRWSYLVSQPRIIDGIICWDGIEVDITKQKQAENELKEAKEKTEKNEQKLKDAQSVAKVGSWETNLLTMEVEWSDETYKIFELDKDQFQDTHVSFLDYVHPNDIERIEEVFVKSFSSKDYNSVQHRIITPSGRFKHVEERWITIHDSNNKPLTSFGTCRDITKQKQIENELNEAKEKAEESDRLKSAFLANMSHEIRTPMNGILGFTDLLKEPDLSGEERDKFLEIIGKSGNRMLNTVNDIIDISKIDAGQVEISNTDLNINEEIENQFEFFDKEATAKGIELRLINKLPRQSIIISDKVKINSIISNLIKNAIKYTDKGSIEILCNKKGLKLEFKITDTGIGIPEDRINSIFNRFEQADIDDTRAFEGSGLGLAISKAYIEILGGKIGVESKHGKGSTFYFTLPWIEKQVKPELIKENEVLNKAGDNQINILIAEDDDISFKHLEIILNNIAKSITRTVSGKEAIEYMKNNKNIDLVLMDVKMPVMDGYEATKEIRKFNKDIIIIAQTAYALFGDNEKAIAAGCNDYISKPINRKLLLELINRHQKK